MLANRFGGIGQAYLDYNTALARRGHAILAVCHRDGGWREATLAQMERWANMEVIAVREKGGIKALPSAWRIRRAVSSFCPDVIIIHNYLRFVMAATRGLAPQVSITHMYKCKHFDRLASVIALTEELKAMCVSKGILPERITIVPNMIEAPFHRLQTVRKGSSFRVGAFGRLDSVKGFNYLIDAAAILAKRGFNFSLKLGGSGFDEQLLRDQVNRLGLGNQVEFTGFVSNKEAFFRKLDCFVIPSTSEPFGIVALESMKYGIPTIASAVGGLCEIFTSGRNGLLVPPATPTALADAIETLWQSPEKRLSIAQAATETLKQRFAEPQVGARLEAALLKFTKPSKI
ncbi:MAG: glycosyltransferase family 4 protein [Opitutales bacterium]